MLPHTTHRNPQLTLQRKTTRGQGIVEYAGAIIVAVTVIVASILAVPPTYNSMFEAVLQNVVDTIPVP